MNVLSIPYSDDLLVATGKSKEELEQDAFPAGCENV